MEEQTNMENTSGPVYLLDQLINSGPVNLVDQLINSRGALLHPLTLCEKGIASLQLLLQQDTEQFRRIPSDFWGQPFNDKDPSTPLFALTQSPAGIELLDAWLEKDRLEKDLSSFVKIPLAAWLGPPNQQCSPFAALVDQSRDHPEGKVTTMLRIWAKLSSAVPEEEIKATIPLLLPELKEKILSFVLEPVTYSLVSKTHFASVFSTAPKEASTRVGVRDNSLSC